MTLLGVLSEAEAEVRYHTVKPGQNLYRIAMTYGVTVKAILDANSGITEDHVPSGYVLKIPDATKPPVPNALNELPNDQQETVKHETVSPGTVSSPDGHWSDGTLNLAVILPFNLNAESTEDNKAQMRYTEFYEGVLMAVDEMQESGRHLKVQAYDTGTQSLYNILYAPEMQEADVVISTSQEDELRQVAVWSDMSGTPVVSPFEFRNSMVGVYQHLFQVNTPKSVLYPRLTEELLSRFADYTFIFLTDSVGSQKADPYPLELKQTLTRRRIPYRELSYLNPERLMACDSILGLKDENILFVPVTPQTEAMRRMFSGLQHVKILRDARYALAQAEGNAPEQGQPKIAVLGYPEWVLTTQEFINYYYDLDVYMFTKFYANPFDPDLNRFYTTFKQWFGKEPMALAPKYALLGYDVAKTFLQMLTHNGRHLEERVADAKMDGLQTPFSFDDGGGRGFMNHGFYLVHFTPESTIDKIVVQ